jgi:hypothetical protein
MMIIGCDLHTRYQQGAPGLAAFARPGNPPKGEPAALSVGDGR